MKHVLVRRPGICQQSEHAGGWQSELAFKSKLGLSFTDGWPLQPPMYLFKVNFIFTGHLFYHPKLSCWPCLKLT